MKQAAEVRASWTRVDSWPPRRGGRGGRAGCGEAAGGGGPTRLEHPSCRLLGVGGLTRLPVLAATPIAGGCSQGGRGRELAGRGRQGAAPAAGGGRAGGWVVHGWDGIGWGGVGLLQKVQLWSPAGWASDSVACRGSRNGRPDVDSLSAPTCTPCRRRPAWQVKGEAGAAQRHLGELQRLKAAWLPFWAEEATASLRAAAAPALQQAGALAKQYTAEVRRGGSCPRQGLGVDACARGQGERAAGQPVLCVSRAMKRGWHLQAAGAYQPKQTFRTSILTCSPAGQQGRHHALAVPRQAGA